MERVYQFLSQIILSTLSVLKVLIRSTFFTKNFKASNNDLFILGNGPSIKKVFDEHLEKLKEKETLCVNKFPDTDVYQKIKPNYYVITSPGYYNKDAIDYNVDVRKKIIAALISKTTWPLICFLPTESKKNKEFINKIKSNQNLKIYFFNTTPIEGIRLISHFLLRKKLGSPRPHNVLIPSILIAINSGFKNIFLLGADHSWLPQISVNDKNEVLINQKHFYDDTTSRPRQMHKNEGLNNRTMDEVLDKFRLSFKSYHDLEKYSENMGSKVINLTPNSFIDAFEKRNINLEV